jgi:hypothetical protein
MYFVRLKTGGSRQKRQGLAAIVSSVGGLAIAAVIVLAFAYGHAYGGLLPALLIGAVVLLGGCPAC